MLKKITEVTEIHLNVEKTDPLTLIIEAKGTVDGKGWSKGELLPYTYFTPPADGVYSFDFLAEAPAASTASEVVNITAKPFSWEEFPDDLIGIKINSSSNHIMGFRREKSPQHPITESGPFKKVDTKELQTIKKITAPFSITSAFIWGDILHVSVQYVGGCRKHGFQLLWDGTKIKSIPLQIQVTLIHEDNGDPCKSIVTEELQFIISDHIQNNAILLLDHWSKDLVYEEEIVI